MCHKLIRGAYALDSSSIKAAQNAFALLGQLAVNDLMLRLHIHIIRNLQSDFDSSICRFHCRFRMTKFFFAHIMMRENCPFVNESLTAISQEGSIGLEICLRFALTIKGALVFLTIGFVFARI